MSVATDPLRTAHPGARDGRGRAASGAGPRRAVAGFRAGRDGRPDADAGTDADADAGAVTAELALGLVSVMLVLGLLLGVVGTAAARLTCLDAARTGARVAATGEGDAAVAEVARAVAGQGAQVAVRRDPPWVVVTVTAPAPGGWAGFPTPSGTATAWVEP